MDRANGNGHSGGTPKSRSSNGDRTLTDLVKEEPVVCLAVAAAAGFLLGGGAKLSGGLTILTMLGQIIVKEAIGDSALDGLMGGVGEERR